MSRNTHNTETRRIDYLYNRDERICQLCNKFIDKDALFEIDHIIEKQYGGTNNISNLRLVHFICHRNRHYTKRNGISGMHIRHAVADLGVISKTVRCDEGWKLISELCGWN